MPTQQVEALQARGVLIPDPVQVFVDADVDPGRIAPGAVLHPGTRLHGKRTYLAAGAQVGTEGPATLRDAVFGPRASVGSGYVEGAVLLRDATLGGNAHVRPGTLLEEQVSTGHCVGLKQTVLLSFVTLGSLINFCDVLMSGGTSRRNHSEVGSGFIHFNYTPWGKSGDKATPSLVGDVTGGVFLNRGRIFLGGSGGLVGPRRVGFGSIAAAGQVVRRDIPEGHLVLESTSAVSKPMRKSPARRLAPIIDINAAYMGQLAALRAWYRQVRAARAPADETGAPTRILAATAVEVIELGLAERWNRLAALLEETGSPVELPNLEFAPPCPLDPDALGDLTTDHIEWIQNLPDEPKTATRTWITSIADEITGRITQSCTPS